jgi:hypothetical protein
MSGSPRNLCGDRSAKKAILEEDSDFSHIARIKTNRHVFSHVGGKRQRNVAKALEVNAIATDFAGSNFLDQQEVELFQRDW